VRNAGSAAFARSARSADRAIWIEHLRSGTAAGYAGDRWFACRAAAIGGAIVHHSIPACLPVGDATGRGRRACRWTLFSWGSGLRVQRARVPQARAGKHSQTPADQR
jgi:hypothetical protein